MTKIVFSKPENIYSKTAGIVLKSIKQVLKVKDTAVLGLPGGRSITKILSNLKNVQLHWNKIHIFMVDERIVPTDHKESNFRLINQELAKIVPPKNLHPFPFNPDNIKQAIDRYNSELKTYGGKFDVIYLSAGEDCHIASLFPKHNSLNNNSKTFIHVTHSPKPPPQRMSISKNLLLRSKIGILLFSGKEKYNAFRKYLQSDLTYYNCPAKLIGQLPQSYVISQFNKV